MQYCPLFAEIISSWSVTVLSLFCSEYPEVRRLPRADPRPLHPQGVGADVARALSQVFRVRGSAHRQVFRQERHGLLQGGFFQVSLYVMCGMLLFS